VNTAQIILKKVQNGDIDPKNEVIEFGCTSRVTA
jgi:hypothetical protein